MLFLLSESSSQVTYKTRVKYLYSSEFNQLASNYLSQTGKKFYYLSFTHGLLSPEEEIEPYSVKRLSGASKDFWALLVEIQIMDIFGKPGKVCLLYSEDCYGNLEKRLRKYYTLYSPIKNFSSNKLKILWLSGIIQREIEYRLCMRSKLEGGR